MKFSEIRRLVISDDVVDLGTDLGATNVDSQPG